MAPRSRILHVINSSDEGGGARHLHALVTRLDPARFDAVVATTDHGPLVERLESAAIRVIDVSMMGARLDLRPVLRLRRLLARERFDLLHLHGTRAGFFGALAASGVHPRPRTVYTVHGLSSSRRAPRPVCRFFARVERFIAGRADRIISVSESDRRSGVEARILPPDRTSSIPNGIDLAAWPEPPAPFSRPGDVEILTLARLVPQKGIGLLLEAAREILRRRPEARFTLIGDGPLRRELEAQARRLGLGSSVRFLGQVADPAGRLGACDLFVLPSLWEGMSISLLEAMAAGRPAVATAVSGSAEVILDGETGVLVEPGDSAALARAVIGMLEDPAGAAAMGARARARVRREFNLERMIESTYALYQDLLTAPALRLAGRSLSAGASAR